jgi:UDP-arabinose 4-epimerase
MDRSSRLRRKSSQSNELARGIRPPTAFMSNVWWMKMEILVLGGAGYIGSHCCKALAAEGFRPVVFDNFSTGHPSFVRWGPVIEGDIRNKAHLSEVMRGARPAAVMHFAALALVGPSVADPGSYYDINVVGTLRALQAMQENGIENLVFSSTCAVYGEPNAVLINERSPCQPVNPYGASKLACERMMDDFGTAHALRSIRLRYFNAAGADADAEVGERHSPETHPFHWFSKPRWEGAPSSKYLVPTILHLMALQSVTTFTLRISLPPTFLL